MQQRIFINQIEWYQEESQKKVKSCSFKIQPISTKKHKFKMIFFSTYQARNYF